MSTIAYRARTAVADTLVVSGSMRDGHIHKIRKIGSVVAGAVGNFTYRLKFFKWVENGRKGESPYFGVTVNGEEAGSGIVFEADGVTVTVYGRDGVCQEGAQEYYAYGSGREFAMGAMAAGATAMGAVKAAMQFDIYSGGSVTEVTL